MPEEKKPQAPLRFHMLSKDLEGNYIPWFISEGAPSQQKLFRAAIDKLCWTCGGKLGANVAYYAGPMCGVTRMSAEPPSHTLCARGAAQLFPKLVNAPGVVMIWVTKGVVSVPDAKGRPLFELGEPEFVEWYVNGKAATKKQVEKDIEAGLPSLALLAYNESQNRNDSTMDTAPTELIKLVEQLMPWLPKE